MPEKDATAPFITVNTVGNLSIKRGDDRVGPSGPTVDTPNFIRGSLLQVAL